MVLNIIIIVKSILNYCQKMDILLIVECGLFYNLHPQISHVTALHAINTHKLVM